MDLRPWVFPNGVIGKTASRYKDPFPVPPRETFSRIGRVAVEMQHRHPQKPRLERVCAPGPTPPPEVVSPMPSLGSRPSSPQPAARRRSGGAHRRRTLLPLLVGGFVAAALVVPLTPALAGA